jgi:hypothetical protein
MNGLYNGIDNGIVSGTYSSINIGIDNGAVSNESNQLNIPLLDRFPGAAVAYSLRKLSANYKGPAIRVRRSSDNAEQDIGFTNNGKLNESSLIAFSLGGDVFVTTWYDQSENTERNAIQTTNVNQPRIVNAGVIDRDGNIPTLFFDGINDSLSTVSNIIYTTNDQFISIVNSPTSTITAASGGITLISGGIIGTDFSGIFYGGSTSTLSNERLSWLINTNAVNTVFGYGQTTDNISGRNLQTFQWYISTIEIRQNNFLQTLSTANEGFLQNTNNRLPRIFRTIGVNISSGASFFNGKIQEITIWGTNQNGNTLSIQSNINQYYKIY